MSTVLRNDKVVLIKEFGKMKQIGQTFEVANFTQDSVVIRNADNKVAVGAININDFDKYFIKAEEAKSIGWTDWNKLIDHKGDTVAVYRTNFKKVQVRTPDGYHAEASCNKTDEFNLAFGVSLAFNRTNSKYLKERKDFFESELKWVNSEIKKNEDTIGKMLKSLRDKSEDSE